MIRGSVEYLRFTLTDDDGADLSGDTVHAAIVPATAGVPDPDDDTGIWLPCTYVSGTRWRTSDVVDWSTDNYPENRYRAYGKVSDTPETPLADLGTFNLTA